MKTPKVISVVFSDLHLNLWSKFNEDHKRTKNAFLLLEQIKDICLKYECPALFAGDFFHKPEYIDTTLLNLMVDAFKGLKGMQIYGISGNHDMNKANTLEKPSPSLYEALCKIYPEVFKSLSLKPLKIGSVNIYGINYLDHNIGLDKAISSIKLEEGHKHILLLHTDFPGAKDTDDTEVGSVENLNTFLLNNFSLVLLGHIHKPQRLGKKIYMIGAPFQQRRTDRNCKMGYWLLYSDLSLEFVELTSFPKFIDVTSQDKVKEDGNYYTVINHGVSNLTVNPKPISTGLSFRKIVRRYLEAISIKDKEKKNLLITTLKKIEND